MGVEYKYLGWVLEYLGGEGKGGMERGGVGGGEGGIDGINGGW